MVATIDNCLRGEWILSCFFARSSGETAGTDAPTRHTGMRPPVNVFAKVDACAAQETNLPVNRTQGLIDIPRSSFAQDELMIPVKGRNAPKSRAKPEDPEYILEAVAEADRRRTLELVCVEHRWTVVRRPEGALPGVPMPAVRRRDGRKRPTYSIEAQGGDA